MRDIDKSKKQLIDELEELRRRNGEFEQLTLEHEGAMEHYRQMVENSPNPIFYIDKENIIQAWNKACEDVFKYGQEMIGQHYEKLLWDAEYCQSVSAMLSQVFQGCSLNNVDISYKAKDGTRRFMVSRLYPILDAAGEAKGCVLANTNIAERKRFDEGLAKSREKYRAIFELSPEAIVLLDIQGNILDINGRLRDWLGYRPEEIIGKHVLELPFIHRESIAKIAESLRQRIAGKELSPYELVFDAKNGEEFVGRVTGNLLRDERGRITKDLVVISDITQRKRAEEELRFRVELEDLVAAISTKFINLASDEIDDGIDRAVKEVGEFAGVDRSYVFRFRDHEKIMDNTHEWCASGIESRIDGLQGVSPYNFPWWMDKLDKFEDIDIPRVADLPLEANSGREILESQNIQSLVVVPMVHGGSLIGFFGLDSLRVERTWPEDIIRLLRIVGEIFTNALERKRIQEDLQKARDELEVRVRERTAELAQANEELRLEIIERKRAVERLRESERKYRDLVENINDMIYTTDENGVVTYISPASEMLFGYYPSELVGHSFAEFIHHEDLPYVMAMFGEVLTGILEPSEYRVIAKSGEARWVRSSSRPAFDENRVVGIQGMMHDITERKQMEVELLKIQKLESVGILAGGIAHDLNNLLTGIVGNLSLIRACGSSVDRDRRLGEAEKAAMQIRDLTQQLLTFSKGGAPILETASIGDLLKDSASFMLRGSNIGYELSISDDLWPVEIDVGQINQVINNLIINSQQAMPEGGTVKIKAENMSIEAGTGLPLQKDPHVKISVEDKGVGIPQDHLPRIFDPFFTTKQSGSGLGLATSYSIIQRHKGHISAESQIGEGTTFHIYLPVSPMKTLTKDVREEEASIAGEGRILVMDDEEVVRELATDMLSNMGYAVVTAKDGVEAIALYREAMESGNPYDIVVMDLTVPGGMGGKEAIQKLMDLDSEVKTIVSSGYSNDPIMADFRKYGFIGVIAKPYRLREMAEILRKALDE